MKPLLTGVALLATTVLGHAQNWVSLAGPIGRAPAFAWDSWRSRGVMFGEDGATWEWDGTRWLQRPTAVAPPARRQAALVFDSVRGHALLFGGALPSGNGAGDTWTWDGSEWRQPFSLLTPPRRVGPAMAFDSVRGRVVLSGGLDPVALNRLDDTWEHDGSRWLQVNPPQRPTGSLASGMAFDRVRGVSVLFGDAGLFEWNGTTWTQRVANHPAVPAIVSLAYDPLRHRTVMLDVGTVREWDGTTWHSRGAPPFARLGHGSAFDDRSGRVLIVGGGDGLRPQSNSVLLWDGVAMTQASPNTVPPARADAVFCHDPARGRTALIQGLGFGIIDDHWEWNGQQWSPVVASSWPPARTGPAACFDPVRGQLLFFGGQGGISTYGDFWLWNGSAWSSSPVQRPPARGNAHMVWDSLRSRAVMFGGETAQGQLNETWVWNGAAWSQIGIGMQPQPRSSQAMAYDPGRDRVVLYGGLNRAGTVVQWRSDTWEFDGTRWAAVATPGQPGPLASVNLVYDAMAGRCLLAGISGSVLDHAELWRFDGADWQPGGTVALGNASARLLMTVDTGRQRILLLAGESLKELAMPEAAAVPFGQGCGAVRFSARTRPRTGTPSFGLEASAGGPLPVLFALGVGEGSVPLGNGCTLLVQQTLATALTMASTRGFAELPVPLPGNHALRGVVLVGQAGVLDAAAPGGFRVSPGLRLVVGD